MFCSLWDLNSIILSKLNYYKIYSKSIENSNRITLLLEIQSKPFHVSTIPNIYVLYVRWFLELYHILETHFIFHFKNLFKLLLFQMKYNWENSHICALCERWKKCSVSFQRALMDFSLSILHNLESYVNVLILLLL